MDSAIGPGRPRPIARRSALALGGVLGASSLLALPAGPAAACGRRLRIALATNEPWGTYHAEPLLDDARRAGFTLTQVVPDLAGVPAGTPVPVATVAQMRTQRPDVLVISGATAWPAEVARALPGVPVVASGLAYLPSTRAPYADQLRHRLVAATAGSPAEAETFAGHLGIARCRVRVVGIAELDDLPRRRPVPGSVLVVTSVTHPSSSGSSAPGTELLLATAHALADRGHHVRVGLHPREDPALWAGFPIAAEGTLAAAARAEAAVGIPGTVFPKIAAVGTPLVAITAPGLDVPAYLLRIAAPARSVDQAVAATVAARVPSRADVRWVTGPVGHAGHTLMHVIGQASHHRRRG